jgi:hypothetical protein
MGVIVSGVKRVGVVQQFERCGLGLLARSGQMPLVRDTPRWRSRKSTTLRQLWRAHLLSTFNIHNEIDSVKIHVILDHIY